MRSSLTSASRFLLAISLAFLVACDDDDAPACGPGDAPAELAASGGGETLTYSMFEGGPNNDCPDPAAPEGVTALSISGKQVGGTGFFTLCIGRPDKLDGELALGINMNGNAVRIVDSGGDAAGCTFDVDSATPPTGTAIATGLCDNGANPAGFALTVDGTYSVERTCGAAVDTVTMTVNGTVAVTGPPP